MFGDLTGLGVLLVVVAAILVITLPVLFFSRKIGEISKRIGQDKKLRKWAAIGTIIGISVVYLFLLFIFSYSSKKGG